MLYQLTANKDYQAAFLFGFHFMQRLALNFLTFAYFFTLNCDAYQAYAADGSQDLRIKSYTVCDVNLVVNPLSKSCMISCPSAKKPSLLSASC